MTEQTTRAMVRILCVDDNPRVAEALRMKCATVSDLEWRGWLASADGLSARVEQESASIVLLDLDMPGKDAVEALAELRDQCPHARVIVFSGHVRRELIDDVIAAGAWGYISKGDGDRALVDAIRKVVQGEFAFSREVEEVWSS